jgi:CRP-like cAMP-binding protein
MRPDALDRLMTTDPGVAGAIARLRTIRAARIATIARDLASLSIERRFARVLLELDERFGIDGGPGERIIERSLRQDDLAMLVGCSRKGIVRSLATLRTDRIADLDRHRISIHDVDRVRAIADDALGS